MRGGTVARASDLFESVFVWGDSHSVVLHMRSQCHDSNWLDWPDSINSINSCLDRST
jgi:hypothetical protein